MPVNQQDETARASREAQPVPTPATRPPLVVLEFPGRGDSYSESFCAALATAGAHVVAARFSFRWLPKALRTSAVAHFHWPSFHYGDSCALAALGKAVLFACVLVWTRLAGTRIVWTAHNLFPHERSTPRWLDYAVRRLIVMLADRIFVHSRTAAGLLQSKLGVDPRRVVPIVHGHFLDYYRMQATRQEARRKLDLPADAPVFALIGNCRRYKNVGALVSAFQRHFEGAWLVIAGKCPEAAYRAELEALIGVKPERIRFEPRYIDDAELQYFFRAADVLVLPFTEVLTSGSAILALSFGRPVVAPRLGNLVDVVSEEVGVLFDAEDPDGLVEGMRSALSRRFDEEQITRYVATLRWEDAARTVLDTLRGAR